MKQRQSIGNRITSLVLSVAILFTIIPLTVAVSAAEVSVNRVADRSTMDGWKDLFPITGEISTENAGGVWMDKSVFTDETAFRELGISRDDPESFLVALSAMAANMSITGMASIPTDTMLVLDVSGSMNSDSGNNNATKSLINAANDSISTLLGANANNRVGVVLYSGPYSLSGAASSRDATVILPLGRYTTGNNGEYLSYATRNGDNPNGYGNRDFEQIKLNSAVKIEGSSSSPAATAKDVFGGTYIQKGVILAMNQFIADSNSVTIENSVLGTLRRKPVMVLMSDGAPTVGSTNFTNPSDINVGTGGYTNAALGFISQLSASYAKAKIEEKYGTEALFYTLGVGLGNDSVAISVMDPTNRNASTAVDDFWNANRRATYNRAAFKGYNLVQTGETVSLGDNLSVTKISTVLEQNYVDKYFSAEPETLPDGTELTLQDKLEQAFKEIVNTIQLQSGYFPTLVAENEDLSGYVSFVDKIGNYMEVTDVKGILIDNKLFSGADLSSNFVAGGGALGTYNSPTELGIEMVAAVKARLGLASDDDARTLIGLAYENGQLSYTDANNYSNYIGWYANQRGKFLGFYNEGTTVLPEITGDPETDPAFVIRSYGYLGAVDESHGVSKSDMMYATVQVRKEIATGEELVTFAVPAALIPIVSYNVSLDENGDLLDLTATGANDPIRLVYEVALDDKINAFNIKEIVSAEYLADPHNVNADGSVNFYTNQWDHENTTGYGTVNTYSYFNPSRQNDRYYYLEDAPVYSDNRGTIYNGEAQPSDKETFYRSFKVYKNNGSLRTETVYRALSNAAKSTAVRKTDGSWYIPKGNVHVNLDGYTVHKEENITGTLTETFIPFVDTHNHTINDTGYNFFVGATLGNNGKLTLAPETGIKLSKTMAAGTDNANEAFVFDIFNETDPQDGRTYNALLIKADGTEVETNVNFNGGKASVELKSGETIYIGGMADGQIFRIAEQETIEYVATTIGLVDGKVTLTGNTMTPVTFINEVRGEGNLTVAKVVEHDFGTEYEIPEDKIFTMKVDLDGIGTANAEFAAEHTNGTYTNITTDENGVFTVQLRHDEQFGVFGLPAGTVATVVEQDIADGFTPAYYDDGVLGDGIVTVVKDSTVSVAVINDYVAAKVYPVNINLIGNKIVRDAEGNVVPTANWPDNYRFEIVLERHVGMNGWVRIGKTSVDKNNAEFSFNDVMAKEEYTAPGAYSYQLYEIEPAIGDSDRVDGMIYDINWHTFTVYVSDADMDGKLEIDRIHSEHADKNFEPVNGVYTVETNIENTQTVTVPALATIDFQKILENASESTLVSLAGYRFGLYTDENCNNAATVGNGIRTIGINPTDAVGEGWIDIEIDETGEYTFYVKEIAGGINKMTYSEQVIKVVIDVNVHPTNANALVAEVTYFDENGNEYDLGNDGEVEFTNVYSPEDTELVIDFVNKDLEGRDLNEKEFTFEVLEQDGTTLLEGTNDKEGNVRFEGTLKFNKVGTYSYKIVETSEDKNGITVDKTVYQITVTVSDNNGKLVAHYAIINVTGDQITFENTYTANPVENAIEGTKTLRGRNLINDEFSFILTEMTVNGEAVAEPRNWTAKNFANGDIVFPTITYNKAGTYVYRVEEVLPESGKAYGITYDKTQYKATVVIEDNGIGNLVVKSETVTLLNDTPANALGFLNEYEANPTWAQFVGNKQLTGKVNNALQGGEFEFILYNSNEDWEQLGERETVENGEGGLITFTKIDFETDEDQYFLVVEKNGGETVDGITFDDAVYRVWVEVTDDLKGQLHAKIHIFDNEDIPQDQILFVNIYEIIGGATVELSGEKTIDGRDWKENDEFTFSLFETDEYFNFDANDTNSAIGTETVSWNDEEKTYRFDLEYTPEDVGKTFYYVIIENGRGETIDGVTYSMAEYQIKVVVEDNDKGGIKTTVTVENATTSTLNFVNDYNAEEATVILAGNKELVGRNMEEGEFKFQMVEADENFKPLEDATVMNAFNEADETFEFDELRFNSVGTYYFVITEDSTANADRITYDETVYHVTIEVADDQNGKLVAGKPIIVKKGETEPIDEMTFTNVFTPEPDDLTVEIEITKTVINKGSETITPEGFEFFLKAMTEGEDDLNAVADEEGKAELTLTFTSEDIGKTFRYNLSEVDTGLENVTYSEVEYGITVAVTLDEANNKLVATLTMDETEVSELAARFENVYDYTPPVPDVPQTGDDTNNTLWVMMMFIAGGAAISLYNYDKKRRYIVKI